MKGRKHTSAFAQRQAQKLAQRQAQGQPAPYPSMGAGGLPPRGVAPGAPLLGMAPAPMTQGRGSGLMPGAPMGVPAAITFWQSLQSLQQMRKRPANGMPTAPSGAPGGAQKKPKAASIDHVRMAEIDAAPGTVEFRTQLKAQGCPIASLGPPFMGGLCGDCGAKMANELNMRHHLKGKRHLSALENKEKEARGEKVEWVSKAEREAQRSLEAQQKAEANGSQDPPSAEAEGGTGVEVKPTSVAAGDAEAGAEGAASGVPEAAAGEPDGAGEGEIEGDGDGEGEGAVFVTAPEALEGSPDAAQAEGADASGSAR